MDELCLRRLGILSLATIVVALPGFASGQSAATVGPVPLVAKVPPYELPLSPKALPNLGKVGKAIKLSEAELALLSRNGFVVTDELKAKTEFDDYVAYYQALSELKLPVFVTSDSVLHYFHVFFDTILMRLEEGYFYNDLRQMDRAFLEASLKDYAESEGDLKEAARRNLATFAVALELTKLTKSPGKGDAIPAEVRHDVDAEIALIKRHAGWAFSPLFIYQEDYSQYVPRGHYTKSERLKRYFLAMMWHGRMTLLSKGSAALPRGKSECTVDGIVSVSDAAVQNLQALLLIKHYLASATIRAQWQRIASITTFFVGPSDDLGFPEYLQALGVSEGGELPPLGPANVRKLTEQIAAIAASPHIYSGLGKCVLAPPFDSDVARKMLKRTQGFRFMGQRFVVDSWLMSEIVSPYSGRYSGQRTPPPFTWVPTLNGPARGFPRGLDVMALLGSQRARVVLAELGDTEYEKFTPRFAELEQRIRGLDGKRWSQDLYFGWLDVLRTMLVAHGTGYPTFMQTSAWQDKDLMTALASWTELRHDTILYVKQSYTMAECEGGDSEEESITGFVEPVPELYHRLGALLSQMEAGLVRFLSPTELKKADVQFGLQELKRVVAALEAMARKQLANERLTRPEYDFIRDFGVTSDTLLSTVIKGSTPQSYALEVSPDALKTTLVADVHTDGNTQQVLEEAVGYLRTVLVAYPTPGGKLLLSIGPVFSQYEWKQPMAKRLTDEAWREELKAQPPEDHTWTKSFREPKATRAGKAKKIPAKIPPFTGC